MSSTSCEAFSAPQLFHFLEQNVELQKSTEIESSCALRIDKSVIPHAKSEKGISRVIMGLEGTRKNFGGTHTGL